jgi:mitochondrial splicing suppressor protein 51
VILPKQTQRTRKLGSRVRMQTWPGLYHTVRLENDIASPHAFVLFNPGIGHPNLRDAWQPTLEMIIESGRPLLLTSFSTQDQSRDLEVLDQLQVNHRIKFIVQPQANPFGSLCYQLDPQDVFSPIQTNSYVTVVQGVV